METDQTQETQPQEPPNETVAALETLRAELAAAQGEIASQREQLGDAEQRALAAHRRALLAEHRGTVIEELVQGDSAEALETSLAVAQSAYQRVIDEAQHATAAQVPTGAPARREDPPESLSALDKIMRGLRK